jgi:signal transduction histidine kinase/CheY-like chemotaxis protein
MTREAHVDGLVAALKASEERYRTLFESMDEGFCVIEVLFDGDQHPRDYRFLQANPAFEAQTDLVNPIGRTMRELAPDHEAHWFEIYGRVALTGDPVRFDAPAEALRRWYDVYAFRIGAPEARQVAVLFNDISERRRQAEALKASWAQLARVFELSPSFLAVLRGPDHVYELVNPALVRLLGDRNVLGRTVREAVPELGRQGLIAQLDRVYATGEPYVAKETPISFARSHADAPEERFLNFVFQPLPGSAGEVTGILVTGVDVTDAVRGRRAAEDERLRFVTVLEQAPLAIAVTGPLGEILFRNPTFDRLWGRPAHVTRADRYSEVYAGYHLDGRPIASEEWPGARAVLKGETVEGEVLEIVHASGRRITVWINAAPVRDADGRITGAVVMFRDITVERRTERQLGEAQRLHAVGTLAGGVAHEVNNALQSTLGFGSFVLHALGPQHPQAADMRLVLQSAERAARVSQQLLAYARQQVSQPRPVDLPALTLALRPVLQQLLGADKVLDIGALSGALAIYADPGQVEQILINLVANARDATETGGRVDIRIEAATDPGTGAADLGFAVPPGEYVRLTVQDNGGGMTAETLARIFDPFFTTKPVGEGTGLGLSMVYGIMKQHNGFIGARSTPGQGTRMELYWPRAHAETSVSAPDSAAPGKAPLGRGRTVLVADDDSLVRMLTVRTLELEGYRVLAAEDGAVAMELVAADGGRRPDLVVTDVVMPRMNGRQLADAVLACWPDVPVLFISGHTGQDAILNRLIPAGAPFLQKPFLPGVLADTAARLLAGVTRSEG